MSVRPASSSPGGTFQELRSFSFVNKESPKDWEQKIFKGSTDYQILREGSLHFLSSDSADAASGLYMKTRQDATPELFLSWKWRVRSFPKKQHPEMLSNRAEDDFAARIYVIFLASNLFRSDVLEYIWDESLPVDASSDSPYSERIKLLVVRSGPAGQGIDGWRQELRNPLADYEKLFGKKPKHPIGIIALMSDSDNTRSQAAADFAEISFKIQRNDP